VRQLCGVFVAAVLAGAAPVSGAAQDFPSRPVTIVVGASAGGSADTAARIIADAMSAELGQQIVIENVPGAGGMTGSARVARAEPNGYTLLMQQTGLVTLPALYSKLNFDVERDLTAVGMVNTSYSFLVGRKSLPANDLGQLVGWMKGTAGMVKFAHPGAGSFGHLTTVLFSKAAGAEVNLIPYRGVGPAMNDLVGEHVDLASGSAPIAGPLIQAGSIKAFAYSSDKPHSRLSNVPTFATVGYPQLSRPFWHALFAPASTPPSVVQRLNGALRKALADQHVRKTYADLDLEAFPDGQLSSEAANAYVRSELQHWGKVIRDNKIQIEP
jgi:tripartite-type tricarboxylate transporter receptor subunit TctC